jgi:hypothetical protein
MEDCKGCYTYTNAYSTCPSRLRNRSDGCPCRICLIKGVCGTFCEEYESFFYVSYHGTEVDSKG